MTPPYRARFLLFKGGTDETPFTVQVNALLNQLFWIAEPQSSTPNFNQSALTGPDQDISGALNYCSVRSVEPTPITYQGVQCHALIITSSDNDPTNATQIQLITDCKQDRDAICQYIEERKAETASPTTESTGFQLRLLRQAVRSADRVGGMGCAERVEYCERIALLETLLENSERRLVDLRARRASGGGRGSRSPRKAGKRTNRCIDKTVHVHIEKAPSLPKKARNSKSKITTAQSVYLKCTAHGQYRSISPREIPKPTPKLDDTMLANNGLLSSLSSALLDSVSGSSVESQPPSNLSVGNDQTPYPAKQCETYSSLGKSLHKRASVPINHFVPTNIESSFPAAADPDSISHNAVAISQKRRKGSGSRGGRNGLTTTIQRLMNTSPCKKAAPRRIAGDQAVKPRSLISEFTEQNQADEQCVLRHKRDMLIQEQLRSLQADGQLAFTQKSRIITAQV